MPAEEAPIAERPAHTERLQEAGRDAAAAAGPRKVADHVCDLAYVSRRAQRRDGPAGRGVQQLQVGADLCQRRGFGRGGHGVSVRVVLRSQSSQITREPQLVGTHACLGQSDVLANHHIGAEVAPSLDKLLIDIPCSSCGHKTGKTFAWMKAHKKFICRCCGAANYLDLRQFRAEIKKVHRTFENLRRKLDGKR